MNLSENAIRVLESRYLLRDDEGNLNETPEQLFLRVAGAIASVENSFDADKDVTTLTNEFCELLTSLDFLPNSPTLMNAGTTLGQLSACFCIPVGDSISEIFDALKNMALIQRTGGGTGFSFSGLRPKDSLVQSTGGRSSGPLSFMKIFNEATEHIKQGGKRRGANMGVLRVDHPDIMEFIKSKKVEGQLRNFNISVGITDNFMKALSRDADYDLIDPGTKSPAGKLNSREVFNTIAEMAWECGDPGLLFLDTINRKHPLSKIGEIDTTNPCGELPMLSYESCNLGSLNLSNMLTVENAKTVINWGKLKSRISLAVRFLDNVIEANKFPIEQIENVTRKNRKIGLGVMGFADMLIKLGIPYYSQSALDKAEQIMSFIYNNAIEASEELADERGVFPNWQDSSYYGRGTMLRNATVTSIAPTGTISIIAGTSSGIEPLFALAYNRRNVLDGQSMYEINPLFLNYCRENDLYSKDLLAKLGHTGNLKQVDGIPDKVRKIFLTALEIPYQHHIKMQASFQKHVDNSVSKTVNMSHEASVNDISKAYLMSYELGCKGITVFRYGSRQQQVLQLADEEEWFEKEYYQKCDPHECKL